MSVANQQSNLHSQLVGAKVLELAVPCLESVVFKPLAEARHNAERETKMLKSFDSELNG